MPKWRRTHLTGDDMSPAASVGMMSKADFARHLYKLMVRKGWNQSELAEKAGLTRNAISTYIRGVNYPSPDSVEKLAAALGLEPEEVFANDAISTVAADQATLEIKMSEADPTRSYLRVNRLVRSETAAAIYKMLTEDDMADREMNKNAMANGA